MEILIDTVVCDIFEYIIAWKACDSRRLAIYMLVLCCHQWKLSENIYSGFIPGSFTVYTLFFVSQPHYSLFSIIITVVDPIWLMIAIKYSLSRFCCCYCCSSINNFIIRRTFSCVQVSRIHHGSFNHKTFLNSFPNWQS